VGGPLYSLVMLRASGGGGRFTVPLSSADPMHLSSFSTPTDPDAGSATIGGSDSTDLANADASLANVASQKLSLFSSASVATRPIELLEILKILATVFWPAVFGTSADIERRDPDEYMLIEQGGSIVNRSISVPRDLTGLNCAAFVAGIVDGALEAARFPATEVEAHFRETDGDADDPPLYQKNVIYIKFAPEVMDRTRLERSGRKGSTSGQ